MVFLRKKGMKMRVGIYKCIKLIFFIIMVLVSCSGGGGGGGKNDDVSKNYIRIDWPTNGDWINYRSDEIRYTSIAVSGYAEFRDGSYPHGDVVWNTNFGYSGFAKKTIGTRFVVGGWAAEFTADVPVSRSDGIGKNVITVTFGDSSATVVVTMFPIIQVHGKITDIDTNNDVADLLVEISDGYTGNKYRTDNGGEYTLYIYQPGKYTITPMLTLPQSELCLVLFPSELTIEIIREDTETFHITGQDFYAEERFPCYSISGEIIDLSPDTDLTKSWLVKLTDALGNFYYQYSKAGGDNYYSFHHLLPGTYEIFPLYKEDDTYKSLSPPKIIVDLIDTNLTNQNFISE